MFHPPEARVNVRLYPLLPNPSTDRPYSVAVQEMEFTLSDDTIIVDR
jgi:hypothetical protein